MINVLREYNEMKDIIKYPENSVDYIKLMEKYFVILEKKNTASKNSSFRRTKQNRLMLL